jgi:hypothetical protein
MFGLGFLLGRNFLPEEGTPGKDHVVLLTYRLSKKLGAARDIIGHTLRMNGELYTVVGVSRPVPGTASNLIWLCRWCSSRTKSITDITGCLSWGA